MVDKRGHLNEVKGHAAKTGPHVAMVCLLAGLFAQWAFAETPGRYTLLKGAKSTCEPFISRSRRMHRVRPVLLKDSPKWADIQQRCPKFLTRESWMAYSNRPFDDYALFRVDIDNDGATDTVLYRRYDSDHYTTYSVPGGVPVRRLNGTERHEEYFAVDLDSCQMDRVLGTAGESWLVDFRNSIYIETLDSYDRRKIRSIFKKQKGVPITNLRQRICEFALTPSK